jgi:hypothetical protein
MSRWLAGLSLLAVLASASAEDGQWYLLAPQYEEGQCIPGAPEVTAAEMRRAGLQPVIEEIADEDGAITLVIVSTPSLDASFMFARGKKLCMIYLGFLQGGLGE